MGKGGGQGEGIREGGGRRREGGREERRKVPTYVFPEAAVRWREGVAWNSLELAPYSCLGTGMRGEIGHWEQYQPPWFHQGCDAASVGGYREMCSIKCSSE